MKQPFNGLFSIATLKNNYLSVGIAAVLLCFSFQLSAQTFDTTRKLQVVGGDGFIWKSGEFLGKMKAPNGLAGLSSKDSGAMSFSNGSMYFWNGSTWNKIGTGTGGSTIITGAPDSTYARFINTTGRNYRIQAVGVVSGGALVGGGTYLQPSDTINRYPRIIAGTNISVTGTYPNLTINSSGGGAAFDTSTIYRNLGRKIDSNFATATYQPIGNYLRPTDTTNKFIRLIAGSNITLSGTAPNITVSAASGGAAFDSTTIYNQVNARVKYSDTASQLNAYKNAISTNITNIANNLAKDISDSATLRNLINVRVTGVTANLPLLTTGTTAPVISLDTTTLSSVQTRFRTDSARSNIYSTITTKENNLGNPSTSGYVLSSTTTGTRSWVAPATGGGGGTVTSVSANAPLSITGGGTISPTVVADTSTTAGFQTKFRTDSARNNIYSFLATKLNTSTASSTYQPIGTYLQPSDTTNRYVRLIAGSNIGITGTYPNLTINGTVNPLDTISATGVQTKFRSDSARTNTYSSIAGKQNTLGFTPYNSTNPNGYISSYTETDPIVKAINGIVKSNGTTIAAAVAGTDYLLPSGNAATATNLTGLTTTVATLNNQSGTNTGDNSPNTLYSGLVTNQTHTGDATGATALTVKGINGTILSSLATGILKITTATGVPSIAVAADFPALNYQAPLTSGVNIQTINGTSILAGTNRQLTIPADTVFLSSQVALKGRLDSVSLGSNLFFGAATVAIASKVATITQALSNQSPYTLLGRASGTGAPSFLASIDSNYAPSLATQNYVNARATQFTNVTGGINYPTGFVGVGNATPAKDIDISKTVNGAVSASATNPSTGTAAVAKFTVSNGTSYAELSKYGTAATTYKTIAANDMTIYNNTSGNMAFLNDVASGTIKFTAGAASNAQLTLNADGTLSLNSKLYIGAGPNLSVNSATLVAGTVTVANTMITASSKVFLTVKTAAGTQGFLSVPTITAGTSFVIQSSSSSESSVVNYWIIN